MDSKQTNIVKEIQESIQRYKTERILLVFLDKKRNVIAKKIVSVGYNKYHAYYYPSDVKKFINDIKPDMCVWAHNHVNDYPEPSDDDDDVHLWFINACKECNVIPYDSIIVMRNNNSYYSYKEHNRLFDVEKEKKVSTVKEDK